MTKDLKNFNSDNPDEIRAVLGPLDDPKDSELYLVRLPQSEEEEREQDLRLQYNMSVRAKREVARMQAKGILNEKGHVKDLTLQPDMQKDSKCTI